MLTLFVPAQLIRFLLFTAIRLHGRLIFRYRVHLVTLCLPIHRQTSNILPPLKADLDVQQQIALW